MRRGRPFFPDAGDHVVAALEEAVVRRGDPAAAPEGAEAGGEAPRARRAARREGAVLGLPGERRVAGVEEHLRERVHKVDGRLRVAVPLDPDAARRRRRAVDEPKVAERERLGRAVRA